MQKSLFGFLLEKQKLKTINPVEKKVMDLSLQIDVLRNYFNITGKYCNADRIQKEVKEFYPSWTGFENFYLYAYHYEAFGNALYSFTQGYKCILKFLDRKITNFPKDGIVYLKEFLADKTIAKILLDRHDAVHQFGKWRLELRNELVLQDWKSAETKIAIPITDAHKQLEIFDGKIINFINEQLQQ